MVGKNGETAHERNKGKKATVLEIAVGEKLLYKRKLKGKMDTISPRWDYGVFVGVCARSGELWIATWDGVVKARSVRRIPVQSRWLEDCVKWVKYAPWNLHKDHPGADGVILEGKSVDVRPGELASEAPPPTVVVCTRRVLPRAFQIRREDAERHGYTRG